jgi:2-succinyl-5-enolpyruvyl-6-hydroxy-3-cyclohexene-1-carboxylate synthase
MSQKLDGPTTNILILTRGVNNIFSPAIFFPPLILEAVLVDVTLIVLAQNRVPSHADQSVNQSSNYQISVCAIRFSLQAQEGRTSHMTSSVVPFFQQGVTTHIAVCLCCGPYAVSRVP